MEFDNGYVITLTESGAQSYDARVPGPVLGNGKLVLMPEVTAIDTAQSMIGGEFGVRNGKYVGNLSAGFRFNRVRFFDLNPASISMQLKQASVNMQSGIYSSRFDAIHNGAPGTELVLPSLAATIEQDLYALRPYPYCVMQSFRVTVPAAEWQAGACFFHEVYAIPTEIAAPTYANALVHNETIASGAAISILSAAGTLLETSSSSRRAVAAASVYLFEPSDDCDFEVLGTNTFMNDPHKCYTKIRLVSKGGAATTARTFRFHLLTATMTDADFPNPVEETKRIVINLRNKAATSALVATRLRAEHVRAWGSVWSSNIHIDPKAGISAMEGQQIQRHVRALRYSLYSVFSCTREGVNVDVNPMNLMITDTDGTSMTDGDLWMVPMLLLIKTDVARAMIEYKHKTLAAAVQLAASYGHGGAKFPYHADVMGYPSALYWDGVSPMYVFNTCVVAINTWNYYRITRDREWMFAKGYSILKHCADFLTSLAELEQPSDPTGQPRYVFRRVAGLSGVEGDNNAFTVYTARVALRYALEASYDLQYPPREAWMEVYQNTSVPFFTDALFDVIRLHDTFPAASTPGSPKPAILEVLMLLLPYYNAILFGTDTRLTASTIFKNLDFYKRILPAEFANHPVNVLLETAMLAQLAQTDQAYADQFYAKLDAFLASNTDGVWGNFMASGNAANDGAQPKSNDIVTMSIYVLLFLQSLGGLRISGGVTETRFLYEEMRIRTNRAGVLPRTWRQLRIEGIGNSKATAVVTNKVLYTTTTTAGTAQ